MCSSKKRLAVWILPSRLLDGDGMFSSSIPNLAAIGGQLAKCGSWTSLHLPSGITPKALRKFVAWQLRPSAFSSISNKNPISQSKHPSEVQLLAVWCRARLRIIGVNLKS